MPREAKGATAVKRVYQPSEGVKVTINIAWDHVVPFDTSTDFESMLEAADETLAAIAEREKASRPNFRDHWTGTKAGDMPRA